ncbi:hypothetical protein [Ensifer soli]|uniref:hypothetical protein n=1 Tax=Ciceribacter sp. sgz301302 TaxID=3342379 RepID=UPI0035BB1FCA
MTYHIAEGDGNGRIDVNGHVLPVSYHLTAERQGGSGSRVAVSITLQAPRDWLIEKGFEEEATLIRGNGERGTVRSEADVSAEDPLSIRLAGEADVADGSIGRTFPELA